MTLGIGSEARAEQVVRTLDWAELAASGALLGGRVLPGAPARLEVRSSSATEGFVRLLVLEQPSGLEGGRWALRGTVSAEGVGGTAYLELWNVLPQTGRFFSRTLADDGPLAALRGTVAERPFLLPFDAHAPVAPLALELNAVVPSGRLVLGPLSLVAFEGRHELYAAVSPVGSWAGAVGGAGAFFGTLLGLLAGVAGLLAAQRTSERRAFGLLTAGLVLSAVLLFVGLVSFAVAVLPFGLAATLLVPGAVGLGVFAVLRPVFRARYASVTAVRPRA